MAGQQVSKNNDLDQPCLDKVRIVEPIRLKYHHKLTHKMKTPATADQRASLQVEKDGVGCSSMQSILVQTTIASSAASSQDR